MTLFNYLFSIFQTDPPVKGWDDMADNEKANRCNKEVVEVEPLKALLTINWLDHD